MKLKTLAEKSGVAYSEKPNGHIQLKGELLVNYYPESKNRSAYVAGTKKAIKHVSPEQAIKMCFEAPKSQGKKDKRKGNSRPKRRAMLKKGIKNCFWCGASLNLDNSTIEHIIPLARGGLDNANNRTLACEKCNQKRGSNMPELEKENG